VTHSYPLHCKCGKVQLIARGKPIMATECHCNSCREAGARLGALDGAPQVHSGNGGTPFAMYRKDRVEITQGQELLKEFRLKPDSPTRRVVATCCNTPVFLEFQHGHWLSIYSSVWSEADMPPIELRTMTKDLPDPSVLDNSVPNGKSQSGMFFAKLLGAWIAMGFKTPKVEVNGEVRA